MSLKITIVMGFFLPVPPVAGGAVEKSWHGLAREFARRGHEVTVISRCWPGWPDLETSDGVRHLHLPGYDHGRNLGRNLFRDLCWSLRVQRHLPQADIIVLNTISLACWLGLLRPRTGKIVAMPGRMPKGQFWLYQRIARILAPSSTVRDAIARERPAYTDRIRVTGYPIDWQSLAAPNSAQGSPLTIGYVGRIHREKGLHLLAAALRQLSTRDLPPWRAVFCGPHDVAQGGSGADYLAQLRAAAPGQLTVLPAIFNDRELHGLYRSFDVFCYPSLAAKGETFGVSVAEAMAAGAVPVVSDLPCFRDFVTPEHTGLTFDANAPGAVASLAHQLATLICDQARRRAMGLAAREAVRRYDFGQYAEDLLLDFDQLTSSATPARSDP
jgi:glycosyltransferase involved in cell wall biosynthesis